MESAAPGGAVPRIEDLVFVGFHSRVAALDRYDGRIVWSWKFPQGSGFVALLLDGDRLIASVQGYTYCIDPLTGAQVWANPMTGFGLGVPSIASVNGSTSHAALGEAQEEESRRSSASGGAH
jgi:outer membrane protein assembly factor BamB